MNRGRHRVPLEGWRKSSQWMGLIREHAELFVNDKVINEIFEAYCSPSNACYSGQCPPVWQLAIPQVLCSGEADLDGRACCETMSLHRRHSIHFSLQSRGAPC